MAEIDEKVRKSKLKWVSPFDIKRNKLNPRQKWDQERLDSLRKSLKEVGILVPLIVYKNDDKKTYTLLDGERRWRMSKKLNLEEVPVNIIKKPSRIDNILRMYNIHNEREGWDPGSEYRRLKELIKNLEKNPSKLKNNDIEELSKLTGMKKDKVVEASTIYKFPEKFQLRVFNRKLKPAYLVEMEPVIAAYKEHHKSLYSKYKKRKGISEKLIVKVDARVITAGTQFRKLLKVLKGEEMGASKKLVSKISEKILIDIDFTISDAYQLTVKSIDQASDIREQVDKLLKTIKNLKVSDYEEIEQTGLIDSFKRLEKLISRILKKWGGF